MLLVVADMQAKWGLVDSLAFGRHRWNDVLVRGENHAPIRRETPNLLMRRPTPARSSPSRFAHGRLRRTVRRLKEGPEQLRLLTEAIQCAKLPRETATPLKASEIDRFVGTSRVSGTVNFSRRLAFPTCRTGAGCLGGLAVANGPGPPYKLPFFRPTT